MILFGRRLKELRKDAHLTQKELGDILNVTKVSICNYEKGIRMASIDMLIDIANYFKVDLDYLIGTDTYVVSDNDEKYGLRMAKEEIILIEEIRKHTDLYQNLLDDPKRTLELIDKKLR